MASNSNQRDENSSDQYTTPPAKVLDESKDVNDLISDDEDDDVSEHIKSTPAIIKRQQIIKNSKWFNSPTDNIQSPCSQRLVHRQMHHKLLVNRLKLDQMKD